MSSNSGFSETEVSEFAVMPCTLPGARSTVRTLTPVANWPHAIRNSAGVGGLDGMRLGFVDSIAWRKKEEAAKSGNDDLKKSEKTIRAPAANYRAGSVGR